MVVQSIDEVVDGMKSQPESWAQLYLDTIETLERLKQLNDDHLHNIAKLERMIRAERGEKVTLQ
ncbi:MAG: hypothetical protein ACPG3T_05145 [Pseudomonadales bacterium]